MGLGLRGNDSVRDPRAQAGEMRAGMEIFGRLPIRTIEFNLQEICGVQFEGCPTVLHG